MKSFLLTEDIYPSKSQNSHEVKDTALVTQNLYDLDIHLQNNTREEKKNVSTDRNLSKSKWRIKFSVNVT